MSNPCSGALIENELCPSHLIHVVLYKHSSDMATSQFVMSVKQEAQIFELNRPRSMASWTEFPGKGGSMWKQAFPDITNVWAGRQAKCQVPESAGMASLD